MSTWREKLLWQESPQYKEEYEKISEFASMYAKDYNDYDSFSEAAISAGLSEEVLEKWLMNWEMVFNFGNPKLVPSAVRKWFEKTD
jgi:alpha-D-ribose 1-methylphosphonate 5-phosphate C-P lyase